MYGILQLILPVFVLIALGVILKRKNIVSDEGIVTLKNLAVNIFLPFTAFNAVIYGTFTKDSIVLILLEIAILFIAYGLGFVYKRFFSEDIRGYVPYSITTFEGGMFGWAMVSMLVGSENLFYLVQMDIFNGLFCFTVVTTGLVLLTGKKQSKKEVAISIITSPLIIAVILGIIGAYFKLGEKIDNSPFVGTYKTLIGFLTQPLSPIILICIGSGLEFKFDILSKGIKLVFFRFVTMLVLMLLSLLFISKTIGLTPVLTKSLLVYFLIPPTFLLPIYANDKNKIEFISGFLSLQIIVSLVCYVIITFISPSIV